jgi:formamidopyrimidine-DNA glycosylase
MSVRYNELIMPELPEVETVARGLDSALVGRTIAAVEVVWPGSIVDQDPEVFTARLSGQRVRRVGRRGKWVVFDLNGGDTLLVHLRMTGRLLLETEACADPDYLRIRFVLDDGHSLCFSDMRKFGRVWLVDEPAVVLGDLGPEPLADDFTVDRLGEILADRHRQIKPLLLDQRVIAGLGNIYVDESLWRAAIHPLRRSDTLSPDEVQRLHRSIRAVLREAIDREGTTLDDRGYVGADGRPGGFAEELGVYGRAGETCPRCGCAVERIVVGQRGTHICLQCQPAPEGPA